MRFKKFLLVLAATAVELGAALPVEKRAKGCNEYETLQAW
jgi:hypothetical protein